MLIAGRANWWLPSRLARVLPRLNVEGSAGADAIERPLEPIPAGASPG